MLKKNILPFLLTEANGMGMEMQNNQCVIDYACPYTCLMDLKVIVSLIANPIPD